VRTRLYRDGTVKLTDFPVADISEHLDVEGSVIRLDLWGPSQAAFDMIGEELGLHELAIEDALHASERPKLDRYATHLFLDRYPPPSPASTARTCPTPASTPTPDSSSPPRSSSPCPVCST
jgi:magnesium transporter